MPARGEYRSSRPDLPLFAIYANDRLVAKMFDPRSEDMFWCSYRVEAVDEYGDQVIHDGETWERVAFAVRDMHSGLPHPSTFSGGHADFCDRKTDRLLFRSLWPPRPKRVSRFFSACAALFRKTQQE